MRQLTSSTEVEFKYRLQIDNMEKQLASAEVIKECFLFEVRIFFPTFNFNIIYYFLKSSFNKNSYISIYRWHEMKRLRIRNSMRKNVQN